MIILSHTTALFFLRHYGAEAISVMPRTSLSLLAGPFDRYEAALERYRLFVESVCADSVPLHLLVPRGIHVEARDYAIFHTLKDVHLECLVRLAEGVYCASPELVARQLAPWGSLCDLVYLLHELCGVYAHPGNARIDVAKRKAFTTKEKLARFFAAQPRFPSGRVAAEALAYVRERSASPMETACAMLLGMPYRLGGYEFPDFEMNREVIVPKPLRRELGRTRMVIDLCWYEQKVAWEYDSSEWHQGAERIARDSSRRNALSRLGFKVITLTGAQASQGPEVARTVRALANALGHRIRPRCRDFEGRRRSLEWIVLKDKASVFSPTASRRAKGRHPKAICGLGANAASGACGLVSNCGHVTGA